MPKKRPQTSPVKVGMGRSGAAGSKLVPTRRKETFEPRERDIARAARKGQSGKKGRPLPSRKVAVKGLDGAKQIGAKRNLRRRKSVRS